MTKLGLHVHRPSPYVDEAIRSCRWAAVKALDNTEPLVAARDAGIRIRILRLYGIENFDAGTASKRWLEMDLSVPTHLQLVCEDNRGYDASWQQDVIDGVIAGGYRGRFLVGGFATGNPPTIALMMHGPHFPQLEPIYQLLRRPDVDLALDEYSGILNTDSRWESWAPYTSQRHRLIVADLVRQNIDVHVVITESGGDNVPPQRIGGGWQTRGWGADEYVALLAKLDDDDQEDARVLARCVFTLNASGDWSEYEIQPVIPALVRHVQGGRSNAVILDIVPRNQLASPDNNASDDCGPECVDMVARWIGLPVEPLQQIKAEMTGSADYRGFTDTTEIAAWFVGKSVEANAWDSAIVAGDIVVALTGGDPVIYLTWSDTIARTGGHFMVAVGFDGNDIVFDNPWGGLRVTKTIVQTNNDSKGGWLVRVNAKKPVVAQKGVSLVLPDDATALSEARTRFAALGVQPNQSGALFKSYVEMTRYWILAGKTSYSDPTPAIRPEASTGTDAYVPLDSGIILHWASASGSVSLVEAKDREAIWGEMKW